jgi:hypothetical protein
MRYIEGGIVWLVTALFLAGTMVLNYDFGSGFGHSDMQRRLFGAMAVGLDLLKAILPVLVWAAWKGARRPMAALMSVIWLGCLAISMASALGVFASSRATDAGHKAGDARALKSVRDELDRKEQRRAEIGNVESLAVVDAKLTELRTRFLWKATKECAEINGRDPRTFCTEYTETDRKRALADEARSLDAALPVLRAQVQTQSAQGSVGGSVAQVDLISRMVGQPRRFVEDGLSLWWVIIIEAVACFGFLFARQHMRLDRRESVPATAPVAALSVMAPAEEVMPPALAVEAPIAIVESTSPPAVTNDVKDIPAQPGAEPVETTPAEREPVHLVTSDGTLLAEGAVVDFALALIDPIEGAGSLSFATSFSEYVRWCSREQHRPMERERFDAELERVAKSVSWPVSGSGASRRIGSVVLAGRGVGTAGRRMRR